jgi:hypothetical protein
MPDPIEILATFAQVAVALAGFSGITIAFERRSLLVRMGTYSESVAEGRNRRSGGLETVLKHSLRKLLICADVHDTARYSTRTVNVRRAQATGW